MATPDPELGISYNPPAHEPRSAPLDLDPETFRALGYQAVDRAAEFLASIRQLPVTSGETVWDIRAALGNAALPETGTDPSTSGSAEDHFDSTCNCLTNWFNPAAWTNAAPFTLGDAPRTDTRQRTPFKKNWDIAIQKTQSIGGRKTLMVRAEIINAFADPNFLGPENRFGASAFGTITQEGGFPRLLQLLVRVGW